MATTYNYGSIDGVKANLPKLAANITASPQGKLDIPEADVESFLSEFSAKADAVLKGKYKIPITAEESKKIIDSVVNDLAAYKLARRYWINVDAKENYELNAMRKDANEIMNGIKDGTFNLPDVDPEPLSDEMEIPDLDSETYFTMEDESSWQDKI